jgi:hypothetical protein
MSEERLRGLAVYGACIVCQQPRVPKTELTERGKSVRMVCSFDEEHDCMGDLSPFDLLVRPAPARGFGQR